MKAAAWMESCASCGEGHWTDQECEEEE